MVANVWWVNQGRSYADEFGRRIVFAGTDGRKIQHHLVLGEMEVGDVTLHYVSGYLRRHRSRLPASATTAKRPYTRADSSGRYRVPRWVKYFPLKRRIPLAEVPGHRVAAGPFDRNGKVKQRLCL